MRFLLWIFISLGRLSCQIENLFYNMIARRKTLQNSSDDYSKIIDLLCRFSIHHINVSFSCRKVGLLVIKDIFYMKLYSCMVGVFIALFA